MARAGFINLHIVSREVFAVKTNLELLNEGEGRRDGASGGIRTPASYTDTGCPSSTRPDSRPAPYSGVMYATARRPKHIFMDLKSRSHTKICRFLKGRTLIVKNLCDF